MNSPWEDRVKEIKDRKTLVLLEMIVRISSHYPESSRR
jgi:hypothetical protein